MNANLELPVLRWLPDGSYLSLIYHSKIRGRRRSELLRNANAGAQIDPAEAQVVRVVEYGIPDREGSGAGEVICVITSILGPAEACREQIAAFVAAGVTTPVISPLAVEPRAIEAVFEAFAPSRS